MTDFKIKRIFWGIGNFYRYRLQILANLSGKHFGWNGTLGVPDVSREGRCLQTSPEQLKATKDKKDKKIGISVPGRLGSFSVGGTKTKTL